ncbi:exodeoxyribonuclease V subunit alpha [Georgenia satyanarayanai]|uniref:exodeoxyribonuclease V subunit alpha n=1 Tax=Georgenia satyanarayanai TaxID=860221 RepID=UPI002041C305|nr:exodeoxyribonuclease V subunit alpha [Georgenia satyanarayanai]MCM3660993.1 exodeoxyribonuclease V subunit alpha [Georgenia satyanarayanai]
MTLLDDGDARLAVHAPPLLAHFNTAGVLAAADVQVARRLGSLVGERDESVLLAVALATRAVRSGSVCLHLEDAASFAADAESPPDELPWPAPAAWQAAIEASPLVAVGVEGPADRPVRWVGGRLYLDRYWRHEMVVRRQADARLAAPPAAVDDSRLTAALDRLLPAAGDELQRQAAAAAVTGRLTVLTGGPGTGKTTTVARLIAVLQDVAGPLRIALAAPTGKAAARLQEAVHEVVDELGQEDRERVGTLSASTLHRLLGWLPGSSTRFRHGPGRHLPHDVVVVDETSMVSLPLMARLLEALRPDARLVLVGDPDQLASVEAGAVLGDLVARTPEASGAGGVVRLLTVHRQEEGSAILPLAAAIRAGDAEETLRLLRAGHPSVELVELAEDGVPGDAALTSLRADAAAAGRELVHAARAGDAAGALRALGSHRLLVAHRRGPAGVAHWSALVEQWVAEAAGPHPEPLDPRSPWYPGRPVLVTANDRETGLYNGDTGVVVADGEGLVAVLGDPGAPLRVRTHRLPAVETVHAMTVHRGQGSQFARVSLVLPPAASPLLTRELLYTAVTRAREHVRVLGSAAAVRRAVQTPVRRASGLRTPL